MAFHSGTRFFRALLPRLVLALAVLLPVLNGRQSAPDGSPLQSPAVEEATPDSIPGQANCSPVLGRTRHLAQLGVQRWHDSGTFGQGVKIAILDTGFQGYKKYLGKALPKQVNVRSFRRDGNAEAKGSQHGILCAEVVHALAPQAELLLANWEPDDPGSFLDAVRWARQEGARVITCSLIMPSWSDGEGGGPVHVALERVLGAGNSPQDVLFFASAGNTAQRHWAGSFCPDNSGYHQWALKVKDNPLRPWGQERVAVELYGPNAASYNLEVIDSDSKNVIGRATMNRGFNGPASAKKSAADKGGCAVVRFLPNADHTYSVRVHAADKGDSTKDKFHLVALGGYLDRTTREGSIPFPADGARVQAVGAVDSAGKRLFYSSCGPNSPMPKPDFVAPVPFASKCRERAFSGTSAAAPQAAALAALWCSRHPDWSANQVTKGMRESARDLGPPGHDCETGYGLVHLP
jgi:subtilisin family serine protease